MSAVIFTHFISPGPACHVSSSMGAYGLRRLKGNERRCMMYKRQCLISVIVTVYNMEEYIEQCIESIMGQDYSALEIIVIDDGSIDNSGLICDAYAKQDNRIKVIHKTNGGLVRARKTGLSIATGDYVVFVDSDDYIEKDFCSALEKYMTDSGADLFHANFYENDSNLITGVRRDYIYDFAEEDRYQFIGANVLGDGTREIRERNAICPGLCLKIFKREFVTKYYNKVPDTQSTGEDLICFSHMLHNCKKLGVTARAFYHYRIREGSMSHGESLEMIVKTSGLYECIKAVFNEYQSPKNVYDSLRVYYKKLILGFLYKEQPREIHTNKYFLSDLSNLLHKRIILYGAGQVGFDLYDQLCRYENIKILDWVDRRYNQISCEYRKIKGLDRLDIKDYDVILVAVEREQLFLDICTDLKNRGIEENHIVWYKANQYEQLG